MAGRIGLVVAGDVYANPSLVRPFLEDDGYRVDAEVFEGSELLPAVSGAMPDALLVNEELLADRPHALEDIRLVSPETKVVVIGSVTGANGSALPDAYLAPGASLATMSVTIGRLVGDGHLGPSDAGARGSERSAGGLIRFVASVGLPLVAVWTLIVAVTPPGVAPPRADTTDLAQDVILTPQGTDRLDEAYDALDRLIGAIRSGNPVMATIWARTLVDSREGAIASGYVVSGLDQAITARLATVLGLLSPATIAELEDILGSLFPELPDQPAPAAGSDLILGPATGSGGGAAAGGGGGSSGQAPGQAPGIISGPIVDGPIVGGPIVGGDDVVTDVSPGDGRAWGQSHKAEHEAEKAAREQAKDQGPPPSANGNGGGSVGDGPGQAKGHDKGQAKGHDKGQAKGHGQDGSDGGSAGQASDHPGNGNANGHGNG